MHRTVDLEAQTRRHHKTVVNQERQRDGVPGKLGTAVGSEDAAGDRLAAVNVNFPLLPPGPEYWSSRISFRRG